MASQFTFAAVEVALPLIVTLTGSDHFRINIFSNLILVFNIVICKLVITDYNRVTYIRVPC